MATNPIPISNRAGNNQTGPPAGLIPTGVSSSIPGSPASPISSNPFNPQTPSSTPGINTVPLAPGGTPQPMTSGAAPGAGGPNTSQVFNAGSTSTNQADTQKQLSDIYGKGVGTDLTNLLNSIGGTDSATLQEYIQSLQPQEATAQANVNAALGAGGVSANSSVAALADANLQSSETAAIAGEEANLTQSGQNLEASILTGTEQAAQQEVAQSGWSVFGQVLSGIGADSGGILKGIGSITNPVPSSSAT